MLLLAHCFTPCQHCFYGSTEPLSLSTATWRLTGECSFLSEESIVLPKKGHALDYQCECVVDRERPLTTVAQERELCSIHPCTGSSVLRCFRRSSNARGPSAKCQGWPTCMSVSAIQQSIGRSPCSRLSIITITRRPTPPN